MFDASSISACEFNIIIDRFLDLDTQEAPRYCVGVAGVAVGLAVGLAVRLAVEVTVGLAERLAVGLAVRLAVGLTVRIQQNPFNYCKHNHGFSN